MESLLLIAVVAAAWYWYSGARAREQVVLSVRRACERQGLQLLDETVLLERMRPRRARSGRMLLRREYSFEFSGEGDGRYRGSVVFFGGRIMELQLETPQGTLYDHD